jgi:deoxyribonuclease V
MKKTLSNAKLAHPWDVTYEQAVAIQNDLCHRISENPLKSVTTVAGIDVSFPNANARAAVVVLSFPALKPLDYATAQLPLSFPYIPGLLAFREMPVVLAALGKLQSWPDLFIFDAHGFAHPRRLGLASHAGVLLDWPSIGCAKSRLIGEYVEPGQERGAWSPLVHDGETIGRVLRTRTGVKPVYVSIGHQIDLPSATRCVLQCAPKYRLPETTRYAHRVAGGASLTL